MSVPSVFTELTAWHAYGAFTGNVGEVVGTRRARDAGAAPLTMRHRTGSAGPGEDDRPPRDSVR